MTTINHLVRKLAIDGGCLVASADSDQMELADARARGDFAVDDDGIGYVRRLPGWLQRHSKLARGATDSCEHHLPPND